MTRPVLVAVLIAVLAAALILAWPPLERDSVAEGLLPQGQRPRLLDAAAPTLEASAAARMIAFAPPGAGPAMADPAAVVSGAQPAAPAPPPVDLTPLLVGVSGEGAATVGYFSYRGQTYRARRGETIGGWKVVSLTRVQARLAKGRRRLTTALFASRSGAISPQMAAAAPPPGAAAPTASPASDATGATAAPPPPGARKRKPLPPLPAGSKGWWSGPKGEAPPPGYTRIPE